MDPVLECQWRDELGWWSLSVHRAGDGWELQAGHPWTTETIPFAGPEEVRRLAQALLDLPTEPVPYQCEWELSGPEVDAAGERQPTLATLAVGLSRRDGHRPYLAYQSYYENVRGGALGMEAICTDLPVDALRAQAHALLSGLPI
ncbi:hypothetical protein ACPC54_15845 [Kitasatospora sp. NPDC094028]